MNRTERAFALAAALALACGGASTPPSPTGKTARQLVRVDVTPGAATLAVGASAQLAVTATYSDATSETVTSAATWQSSDRAIAGVTGATVTAFAAGDARVTASWSGKSGGADIHVVAAAVGPPPQALRVEPPALFLGVGQRLAPRVVLASASGEVDVTGLATLSLADVAVASAAGAAVVGDAVGRTTLTVRHQGATATATVTVEAATLASLAIADAPGAVPVGAAVQLRVLGTYDDGSTRDLTPLAAWETTDRAVAAMAQDSAARGVATAIAAGGAEVVASWLGFTASARLAVVGRVPWRVEVRPAREALPVGATLPLSATAHFNDGTSADVTSAAAWTSSSAAVTVSAAGTATTASLGPALVTATYGGVAGDAWLEVRDVPVASVHVATFSRALRVGEQRDAVAIATFADGATADVTSSATWTTADPGVVAIVATAQGVTLRGVAPGAAVVSAAFAGASDPASYTVAAPAVRSLAVAGPRLVPAGFSVRYAAVATYDDGSTEDVTERATWSAPVAGLAVSDSAGTRGLATASGTATAGSLVARFGGVTGFVGVSIAPAPTLAASAGALALRPGDAAAVGVNAVSGAQAVDVTPFAAWESSDPSVVEVPAPGALRARAPGLAFVTASLYGETARVAVTVSPALLVALSVAPDPVSVAAGHSLALAVTGTWSDGTVDDLSAAAAIACSGAVAACTSGARPLVRGVREGTDFAWITAGDVGAVVEIAVGAPDVVALEVAPASLTLLAGGAAPLRATARRSDGTAVDVTADAAWVAAAGPLAVSGGGVVTAGAAGSGSVRATYGGAAATVAVEVKPAAATLSVIAPATVEVGDAVALSVKANGTIDVTAGAVFTAAATGGADPVVEIAGATLAAVRPGTVSVTASLGGAGVATATVRVVPPAVVTAAGGCTGPCEAPAGTRVALWVQGTTASQATFDLTEAATWTSTPAGAVSDEPGSRGVVAAIPPGGVDVVASYAGVSAPPIHVDALPAPVGLEIEEPALDLWPGERARLDVVAVLPDGTRRQVAPARLAWASSAAAVAGLPGDDGSVLALAGGETVLTATYAGHAAAAHVRVDGRGQDGLFADLFPAATLPAGTTARASAHAAFGLAVGADDLAELASWSSSRPDVASVSDVPGTRGLVAGVAPGTAVITARYGGLTAQREVTVGPAALAVTLTPARAVPVPLGGSASLAAEAEDALGTSFDVTPLLTFAVDDGTVARVGPGATLFGLRAGTTRLVALRGSDVVATAYATVF